MDIGLILSIAAGVVLGGLVLIYREKIVDKGKEAAELTTEGAKVTGRGIYAIRGWLITILVVSGIAAIAIFTRVENDFEHWKVNHAIWGEIKTACRENGGDPVLEREYFYCLSPIDLEAAERWSWQYARASCQMIYYAGGERIRDEYVDACAEVAFQPYYWQQILKERERQAGDLQP